MQGFSVRGQVGLLAACAACAGFTASPAWSDVTIGQNTAFDFASLVHVHGSNSTIYTDDKERRETQSHCEGVMSLVCGNLQDGEIVRLDRGLTWQLDPKHKRYREDLFATPEQRAAMKAQLNERLEKMRSCPTSQKQEPVDKSKCKMSPPKFDVRQTGDRATIAGFATQRTLATVTESCTNVDTGDTCDIVVAVDAWMTSDTLPGAAQQRTFELAYAKKLGLDDMQGMLSGQMATYLAPYQTQLQDLREKAKQFKGSPLRTSFRILTGGPHCNSAKADSSGDAAGGADSQSNNPVAALNNAKQAMGSLVGGLFKKKKPANDEAVDAAGAPTAPAGIENAAVPTLFPQMVQLASFSSETTVISVDPAPPSAFEVPADWVKEQPKEVKQSKDDFTCPKTGS